MKKNMSVVAVCGLLLMPSLCKAEKGEFASGVTLGVLITGAASAAMYYVSKSYHAKSSKPLQETIAPLSSERACRVLESEIRNLHMQLEQNKKYESHALESVTDIVVPQSREELKQALKNNAQRADVILMKFVQKDRDLQLQHFKEMGQKTYQIQQRIALREQAVNAWKAQQAREAEEKKKAEEAAAAKLTASYSEKGSHAAGEVLNPGQKGDYAETAEA